VLYSFQGTTWEGVKPEIAPEVFQLIHNNTGFAPYVDGCTAQEGMNAYICE